MTTQNRWASALTLCLGLMIAGHAQAQYQRNYGSANAAAAMAGEALVNYNNYNYGYSEGDAGNYEAVDGYYEGCNTYAGNCCGNCSGGCGLCCGGEFFVGADYLHIRSTFSESTAYVTKTGNPPIINGGPLTPPIEHVFHELDYDYEPSYRVYGGYRWCECGGEIRFAYTQFDSSGAADSGPVPVSTSRVTQFLFPGELPAVNPGDRIVTTSNVNAKIYDLAFAKTIPLGSPPPCCDSCCDTCTGDCCDSCCNSCCCRCPAWDIKWSAGIRFADVGWDRTGDLQSADTLRNGEYRYTEMDFQGGGARVGLEGTRYIGRYQRFAIFARSDISILLGEVSISHVNDNLVLNNDEILTHFSSTQLIPVLDIEAGASVFLTDCLTLSAGYLFSAWHDLGMRDTFDVLEGLGPTYDDANLLGFDGFFARTEFSF